MNVLQKIISFFYREPDQIIGSKENPYMKRWILFRKNKFCNIYLHKICRSDDDRAYHNHPFPSASIMIEGSYIEKTPKGTRKFSTPCFILRESNYFHKLIIESGKPCWTIFFVGWREQPWGFLCPQGFVKHQKFLAQNGCGEE